MAEPSRVELERWLIERVARLCRREPDGIDPGARYEDLGLSSRQLMELSGELEDYLGLELDPEVAWDHPTIRSLAAHLAP